MSIQDAFNLIFAEILLWLASKGNSLAIIVAIFFLFCLIAIKVSEYAAAPHAMIFSKKAAEKSLIVGITLAIMSLIFKTIGSKLLPT